MTNISNLDVGTNSSGNMSSGLWVERLALTNFRSYASASVTNRSGPQVIVGANGSGKTNLLEALSLLSPGQGLRRVPFSDLVRSSRRRQLRGCGACAHARGAGGYRHGIGAKRWEWRTDRTHRAPERSGRIVRIDGTTQSGSGMLADYLEIVWVTPAMDGLFTGPASERRRFLDRLILCFDHGYRTIAGRFERAMTSRNRLLADGVRDNAQLSGFERVMAETGIAVAAARLEAVAAMAAIVDKRRTRDPNSAFPWSSFRLEGTHRGRSATPLGGRGGRRSMRERSARRGSATVLPVRTLDGPHRSDLSSSMGRRRWRAALLDGGAEGAAAWPRAGACRASDGTAGGRRPILLLDEITAHLDADRRAALFAEILRLERPSVDDGNRCRSLHGALRKGPILGCRRGKNRGPISKSYEEGQTVTSNALKIKAFFEPQFASILCGFSGRFVL